MFVDNLHDAVDEDAPAEEERNSDPVVGSLHDGSAEKPAEAVRKLCLEAVVGVARTLERNTRSRHSPPLWLGGRGQGLGSEGPRTWAPENWSWTS